MVLLKGNESKDLKTRSEKSGDTCLFGRGKVTEAVVGELAMGRNF